MENNIADFILNENISLDFSNFLRNLITVFILSILIQLVYNKFSQSLSNKDYFSKNFVVLGITTCIVITIVKSSLALSLGLVGALSIIRFRTAIKEPEEISYLFICIGIGLGLGASYKLITIMSILLIIILIIIKEKVFGDKEISSEAIYLTLNYKGKLDLNEILSLCSKYCTSVYLRDFDLLVDNSQVGLIINFDDTKKVNDLTNQIKLIDNKIEINLINKHDVI